MHSLNSPLSPKLHSLNTSDDEALGDALLRAQQQRTDSWTVVSNLDRFFQKVRMAPATSIPSNAMSPIPTVSFMGVSINFVPLFIFTPEIFRLCLRG